MHVALLCTQCFYTDRAGRNKFPLDKQLINLHIYYEWPASNLLIFIFIAYDPAYFHFYSRVDKRLCLWNEFYIDSFYATMTSLACGNVRKTFFITSLWIHTAEMLVGQLPSLPYWFRRPWHRYTSSWFNTLDMMMYSHLAVLKYLVPLQYTDHVSVLWVVAECCRHPLFISSIN